MPNEQPAGMWTKSPKQEYDSRLELEDSVNWWRATVRKDGCFDLKRIFNGDITDSDNIDCIHICDLDELIQRLQELKKLASEHFGKWPE